MSLEAYWTKVRVECPTKPVVSKNTLGRVLCNDCYKLDETPGDLSGAGIPGTDDSEEPGDISVIQQARDVAR